MCRREKIKPRGLTTRSWTDWEAGTRPNSDYQDLLSRPFQASPVRVRCRYGPEAAGMAESTDQLTGASSGVTWTYSCTGRAP